MADWLEILKNWVEEEGRAEVARQLAISEGYLSRLITGKRNLNTAVKQYMVRAKPRLAPLFLQEVLLTDRELCELTGGQDGTGSRELSER